MSEKRPGRWGRRLRMLLGLFATLAVVLLVLTWISTDHFRAFGGAPAGERLARMQASPQFADGKFHNAEPTALMAAHDYPAAFREWMFGKQMRVPSCPLPLVTDAAARLASPAASGLRVTWLGHSTTLIEIDGARILTDPVWGERASPSRWVGPSRLHPPPLALAELPPLDAVVISHEHYDHLDMGTVVALGARGVVFHVPLGVGAHLAAWGIPAAQIVEHDWWQEATIAGGVRLVSTPARHFNGRGIPWRVGALWTSWSIVGPRHRLFFSGDTGLTTGFDEVARRFAPFDVALLEIGQYHESWGTIHLGPQGALEAFARLRARTLLPIHWSTFVLAYHAWSEPAETLVEEAAKRGLAVVTPRLGEPVEPVTPEGTPATTATSAWWRALPPIAPKCPEPSTVAPASGSAMNRPR
ncbi:MAG TPA: MBL fold metallo-hydrolase [Polyangia bacterium]|nr:MBL fold metallo-hydrolase [Polyangia bacterium]